MVRASALVVLLLVAVAGWVGPSAGLEGSKPDHEPPKSKTFAELVEAAELAFIGHVKAVPSANQTVRKVSVRIDEILVNRTREADPTNLQLEMFSGFSPAVSETESKVLWFLGPRSESGLVSTVGITAGSFRVYTDGDWEVAVNQLGNADLWGPAGSIWSAYSLVDVTPILELRVGHTTSKKLIKAASQPGPVPLDVLAALTKVKPGTTKVARPR
jgi:hypothetical protein